MAGLANCNAFITDLDYWKALKGTDTALAESAWKCLYQHNYLLQQRVLDYLGIDKYNTENIKDAEDAYEESLIALLQCIRKDKFVPGESRISAYLFKCCVYCMYTIRSKRSKFINTSYQDLADQFRGDDNIAGELEKDYQQKLAVIKTAVTELRKGCADILSRFLYGGEEAAQIAASLNIGLLSVRTDISRCKNDLVKLLISKYKFPPDGIWL
jgi:DNA-directed RNA polymerase specialized sigma24 family protein